MALLTCSECGQPVSDKASACPHCGCPITPQQGTLEIVWKGGLMVAPPKVEVRINGVSAGYYSFIKGFDVKVPISSQQTRIDVAFALRTMTQTITCSPGKNYVCVLDYSRLAGIFKMEVIEKY